MKTYCPSIRAFALILFATTILSNLVHAQRSVELILNGGFETGDLTSWRVPVPNPNPWTASAILPHTGNYSAYNPALEMAVGATTLYQNFSPTPVSAIATAGFWYYHPAGAPGTVGLATRLLFSDGTAVQDTLYADDPSYQVNVWAYRDLLPTLSAYSDKVLTGIGFYPKWRGSQYVDDVSIIGIPTIPEPSTVILGCLGLLLTVCIFGCKYTMPIHRWSRHRPCGFDDEMIFDGHYSRRESGSGGCGSALGRWASQDYL